MMSRLLSRGRICGRGCGAGVVDSGHGFTLAEALIAAAIGSVVLLAFSQAILSYFVQSEKLKLVQYFKEETSRFNYLLSIEAGESSRVTASPPSSVFPAECKASGATDTLLLRLDVPKPTGDYSDETNVSGIYYFSRESGGLTNLMRCGPPFKQNGTINHSAAESVPAVVIRDATLNLYSTTACNGVSTSSRQVAYQVSFNSNTVNYAPPCSVAKSKTFLVRDATL